MEADLEVSDEEQSDFGNHLPGTSHDEFDRIKKGPPTKDPKVWFDLTKKPNKRKRRDDSDEDYEEPKKASRKKVPHEDERSEDADQLNHRRRQADDEVQVGDRCDQKKGKRRTGQKQSWTPAQIQVVKSSFKEFFTNKKLPGKLQLEACIAKNPCLFNRRWTQLKDFIRNSKKHVK